ncbi:MAG: EAL domain-containing protein [Aquisalimonadaceae bacterium]
MNQDEVLRLLIADESLNDAEVFISVLRNAGHAVRATHVMDEDDLRDALADKPFDLFLCSAQLETLPFEQAVQYVQQSGRDLPMIAIAGTDSSELRRTMMQKGAMDLVSKDDMDHMKLVISRESSHLRERRRLRRLEKALRETEKRCSALLDSSRDAIAYVHEGMHIYANGAYLERFGFDAFDEIEGMPLLDMISADNQQDFKELLRSFSRGDHSVEEMDLTMLCDQGPMDVTLYFSDATIDGEPCTQILIRNRSSAHKLEQQLDTLTRQDLATGLFNRQHFQEQLESAMAEKGEDEDTPSHGLLYIQIDNVNVVRQILGPTGCDKVMADLAELLRAEMDDDCIAGRFTDDVLTVLLPSRGVHETVAVGEAIRTKLEDHIVDSGGRTVTSTCSVGAIMIGERSGDINQVLADAVTACDTARHAGGNQVHLHSAAGGEEDADESRAWKDRLEDALAQDRFFLVFMPVASLSGDTTIRYETRIRLRDEDGSTRIPADFIGPAERCGVMARIDRWVVLKALESIDKKSIGNFLMFIKLSGETLADSGFLPFLAKTMKANGIPGKCISFQVNEPVAVTQLNDARRIFRGLKELGCGFSLDHFGSGLNPFQLVKHLPADYLKLDRSLMQELTESEEVEERVRGIIENAHSMKKLVIAGYLEDAGTLARLWQHQVDFVQGNFLQAPSEQMNYDFSGMVI